MLNPADPAFETVLRDILLASAFRNAAVYVTESRGEWRGQGIVVAPTTTAQVAAVPCCHSSAIIPRPAILTGRMSPIWRLSAWMVGVCFMPRYGWTG